MEQMIAATLVWEAACACKQDLNNKVAVKHNVEDDVISKSSTNKYIDN